MSEGVGTLLESFFSKAAQIIVQARRLYPPQQRRTPKGAPPPFGFFLDIPKIPEIYNATIADINQPMFVRISLDYSQLDPAASRNLSILQDNTLVGIQEAGADNMLLLEQWTVMLDTGKPSKSPLAADGSLIRRRLAVLERSIYVYLRMLPAYDLAKKVGKNHLASLRIVFSISSSSNGKLEELEKRQEAAKYLFRSVDTVMGSVSLSVLFRKDVDIVSLGDDPSESENKFFAGSKFVEDYYALSFSGPAPSNSSPKPAAAPQRAASSSQLPLQGAPPVTTAALESQSATPALFPHSSSAAKSAPQAIPTASTRSAPQAIPLSASSRSDRSTGGGFPHSRSNSVGSSARLPNPAYHFAGSPMDAAVGSPTRGYDPHMMYGGSGGSGSSGSSSGGSRRTSLSSGMPMASSSPKFGSLPKAMSANASSPPYAQLQQQQQQYQHPHHPLQQQGSGYYPYSSSLPQNIAAGMRGGGIGDPSSSFLYFASSPAMGAAGPLAAEDHSGRKGWSQNQSLEDLPASSEPVYFNARQRSDSTGSETGRVELVFAPRNMIANPSAEQDLPTFVDAFTAPQPLRLYSQNSESTMHKTISDVFQELDQYKATSDEFTEFTTTLKESLSNITPSSLQGSQQHSASGLTMRLNANTSGTSASRRSSSAASDASPGAPNKASDGSSGSSGSSSGGNNAAAAAGNTDSPLALSPPKLGFFAESPTKSMMFFAQ